jgi:hypothetical protein
MTSDETEQIDLKDDKTKAELVAVMKEISSELDNIEAARDQIKEIIAAASDTFDISKGLLRKVSRFYHKRNIAEYENEAHEIKSLYSQLTVPTKKED